MLAVLKLSNLTAVSALFQQATASTAENSGKNTHNVKNIATIRCLKNDKLLTHRKKEIFRSKTFKNLHKNTPSDFHCYFRARACDIAHAQMGIVLNRKWIERTSVSLVGEAHFLQNVTHEVGGLEHILSWWKWLSCIRDLFLSTQARSQNMSPMHRHLLSVVPQPVMTGVWKHVARNECTKLQFNKRNASKKTRRISSMKWKFKIMLF